MARPCDHLAAKLYDALNGKCVGHTNNTNNISAGFRSALAAEIAKQGDLNEGKTEKERWDEVRIVLKMIQGGDSDEEISDKTEVNEEEQEQGKAGIEKSKKRRSRGSANKRYNKEELAWLWRWFRENATSGPKWFLAASTAFKQRWNRPDPEVPDYGVRNVFQAMKSSGQFEEGMRCDEAFYAVEANFPRKIRQVKK